MNRKIAQALVAGIVATLDTLETPDDEIALALMFALANVASRHPDPDRWLTEISAQAKKTFGPKPSILRR